MQLTLDVADGAGSGADATEYQLDGGAWTAYAGAVTIAGQGVHDVQFRSTDVAGNEEEAGTVRLKVDGTAPVTTARINGAAPLAEYFGPVRIAFMRTDEGGSGAVATEYRIGDGAWTAYTDAFDVQGLRGHRVDFRSRDLAGNVENFRSVDFVIRPAPAAQGDPPPVAPLAADPAPFAAMQRPAGARSTIRALRRGRLVVRVTCQGVQSGTLQLKVSRKVARRLGLERRVLATAAVRCGEQGRATATLNARPDVNARSRATDGRCAAGSSSACRA